MGARFAEVTAVMPVGTEVPAEHRHHDYLTNKSKKTEGGTESPDSPQTSPMLLPEDPGPLQPQPRLLMGACVVLLTQHPFRSGHSPPSSPEEPPLPSEPTDPTPFPGATSEHATQAEPIKQIPVLTTVTALEDSR